MGESCSLCMPILVLLLVVCLANVLSSSVYAQDEFGARSTGVVRIESEVKMKLPIEQRDSVWQWLQKRFTSPKWLNRDGYAFNATFGDEDFTDTYFDTPDLRLLMKENGVRHRTRVVKSGPAHSKDGRQLIQIKLGRGDATRIARSEIKFEVSPRGKVKDNDDFHPMIGLVKREQRGDLKAAFDTVDIDPYVMRPILTLQQNRKRVYLSDQKGAFATITVDLCSTSSWGAKLRWLEMELELNEIRYTESDELGRAGMEKVIDLIQGDLLQAFPAIVQDQTPKYNTSFTAIESATWMPLRLLVRMRMDANDFIASVLIGVLAVCGLCCVVIRRWRRRRPRDGLTHPCL